MGTSCSALARGRTVRLAGDIGVSCFFKNGRRPQTRAGVVAGNSCSPVSCIFTPATERPVEQTPLVSPWAAVREQAHSRWATLLPTSYQWRAIRVWTWSWIRNWHSPCFDPKYCGDAADTTPTLVRVHIRSVLRWIRLRFALSPASCAS